MTREMTRAALERRLAAVCEEIRHYPTPIARCDEQLTALIEERSKLFDLLDTKQPCTPDALWVNDGGLNAA
jgi:hypothetical protein